MKAMILAAGRGRRLRPLTDYRPKALVKAGGKPLIVWVIEYLQRYGFEEIVINTGWLGDQIPKRLGDGNQWGVNLRYSTEPTEALGTAGGIVRALPLLGDKPFLVINADVWTDFPLQVLALGPTYLANIVLTSQIPVPEKHDFSLSGGLVNSNNPNLSYTGIGIFHPELFGEYKKKKSSLGSLLHDAAHDGRIQGTQLTSHWFNVGTKVILNHLEELLTDDSIGPAAKY